MNLFKQNKKGQVGRMQNYFSIFIGIVVIGFVFFILSDSLQDSQGTSDGCDYDLTYDTATNTCLNSSDADNNTYSVSASLGYNASSNLILGMFNATDQMPTAGTLIGIGVILSVIALGIYGAKQYGLF